MNNNKYIAEVLEHLFPDECDFAGPANIELLAAGPVEIVRTEHGSNIDLSEIIIMLAGSATFIKNTIDIYKAIAKARSTRPKALELKEAVEPTKGQFSTESPPPQEFT